jgi:hypothetical protein
VCPAQPHVSCPLGLFEWLKDNLVVIGMDAGANITTDDKQHVVILRANFKLDTTLFVTIR